MIEPGSTPTMESDPHGESELGGTLGELQLWRESESACAAQIWHKQVEMLSEHGLVQPPPDFDEIDRFVGHSLFVMEHGPCVLLKVDRKKEGLGTVQHGIS